MTGLTTPDAPASAAPAANPRQPGRLRTLIFALLVPALLLLGLEATLRLFDIGTPPALFVPAPVEPYGHDYLLVNPRVGERYFSRHDYVPRPPYEMFARQKPANGYRLFVLGGSTVAGWPYPNNVMFSRLLQQRLAATFPGREIEVVNVAMSAINSFTLLDYVDEVLAQQPDALLIYAGHNEFYGALGAASAVGGGGLPWLVRGYLRLLRLHTVYALRELIEDARYRWAGARSGSAQAANNETLMGRVIGQQEIPLDSALYTRGHEQFADNLDAILGRAGAVGVPVILSELVSNVRDQQPFASTDDGALPPAAEVFDQARAFEAEGRYELARDAYYRAKDLDAMRFRASEEFNAVIHKVAAAHGAAVVPMKALFEQASPHGLIGGNLMLEHLHPNVEGQLLMSAGFFDALRAQRLIAKEWDGQGLVSLERFRQNLAISELDRAIGRIRVLHLMDHWPFKPPGEGGRALERLRPSSRTEELAYYVFRERISLTAAHAELAERHLRDGRHDLAELQFRALAASSPLHADHYVLAAYDLIRNDQAERAQPFIERGLALEETSDSVHKIAEAYLLVERLDDAIPYLERARALEREDPVVLYNLCSAYILTGDRERAQAILDQLGALYPEHPNVIALRRRLDALQ